MKTIILTIISFFVFSAFTSIENVQLNEISAFKSGETLKYRLHYGFIDGGLAFLNIEEKTLNGRKVFHAKAFARTAGIADKLFNVRDLYECYFDAQTCTPLKSVRNITEGKYKLYNEVDYFVAEKKAHSQKTGEHKVPENIQDFVSAFYFARNTLFSNIKTGDIITINTFFDDKIYPLKIRYRGIETISCNYGKIKCMKFSPEVEPGRVFDTKDDLDIWISADINKVPVRIQMNLAVGSVKCDLVESTGLIKSL